ncbi:MAG: hypothetical protein ACI9UU_001346, partial [Candidatus Azotimanducaceae bacterium]
MVPVCCQIPDTKSMRPKIDLTNYMFLSNIWSERQD